MRIRLPMAACTLAAACLAQAVSGRATLAQEQDYVVGQMQTLSDEAVVAPTPGGDPSVVAPVPGTPVGPTEVVPAPAGEGAAGGVYYGGTGGWVPPWHAGYYHTAYGRPVPLVVPPTATFQTNWGWGIGNTRVTPIYPQFSGPYPGYAYEETEGWRPMPSWPTDTLQFGVYYVRGPFADNTAQANPYGYPVGGGLQFTQDGQLRTGKFGNPYPRPVFSKFRSR